MGTKRSFLLYLLDEVHPLSFMMMIIAITSSVITAKALVDRNTERISTLEASQIEVSRKLDEVNERLARVEGKLDLLMRKVLP